MIKTRPSIQRQISLDTRLSTPKYTENKYRSINNIIVSSPKNIDEVLETHPSNFPTVHSHSKKPSIQSANSSMIQILSPSKNSHTPSSLLNINRKLTKGYTRFMQEKVFMDRRTEEKSRIEKEVRKTLSSENPLLMSPDIQRLITSSIVNNPVNRPRTVFKISDTTDDEQAKLNEKGRDVVQRIFGTDLEDNLLFMKIQHGHSSSMSLQSIEPKFIRDPSKDKNFKKDKKRKRKLTVRTQPGSMISIPPKMESSSAKNSISVSRPPGLKLKLKNMSAIDTIKEFRASDVPGTLDDLDLPYKTKSSRREVDDGIVPLTRTISKISQGSNITPKNDENHRKMATFNMTSKNGLFMRNEIRNASISNINLDSKTPLGTRTNIINSPSNTLVNSKQVIMESKAEIDATKDDLNKINKLCKGAMKSSSRLGHRLKKQSNQVGKDYRRLDVQWEKFDYTNTLKNWERSIKNVENIHKRSSFFNTGF